MGEGFRKPFFGEIQYPTCEPYRAAVCSYYSQYNYYHPGDPGWTQTSDLLIRSEPFYSSELRGLRSHYIPPVQCRSFGLKSLLTVSILHPLADMAGNLLADLSTHIRVTQDLGDSV